MSLLKGKTMKKHILFERKISKIRNNTLVELSLISSLANLVEWSLGNRGPKTSFPYSVPEVKDALQLLGHLTNDKYTGDYLSINTKALSTLSRGSKHE